MSTNSYKRWLDARRRGEAVSGNGPWQKPIDQMTDQELEQEIYDLKRQAVEAGRQMVSETRGGAAGRPQFLPNKRRKRSWK